MVDRLLRASEVGSDPYSADFVSQGQAEQPDPLSRLPPINQPAPQGVLDGGQPTSGAFVGRARTGDPAWSTQNCL